MGNSWVSPIDSTTTWGDLLYQMVSEFYTRAGAAYINFVSRFEVCSTQRVTCKGLFTSPTHN